MIHFSILLTLFIPVFCALYLGTRSMFTVRSDADEHSISKFIQTSFALYLLSSFSTLALWAFGESESIWQITPLITFKIDLPGLIYLCTIAILTNIILFYCRRYLHRDPGYQRFFMVISMFVAGLTLVAFAGNFELIFAGWEFVGLSSYLLIGFYWHRPQAARNANRAYYIYRVCDLGLLAAAFIAHLETSFCQQWALSLMILIAVVGKSAQFPISYWLPRAMEGPTPSSAIFYGALSIHAGVFLLIRTFDIWFYAPGFVWVVGSLGLTTAIFATLFGRVQANIKGQIGYASIAQVGIMLVELAFGFPNLALIHMTGNAFFRCFQLLVSPSVVAQQLQIHGALLGEKIKSPLAIHHRLNTRVRDTLYLIAVNEAYLQNFFKFTFTKPIKYFWVIIVLALIVSSHVLLATSLLIALFAFSEKKSPFRVLSAVALSNIIFAGTFEFEHKLIYLSGIGIAWLLCLDALRILSKQEPIKSLSLFSGYFGRFPLASTTMLLGILGIIGFPLSSTFWCEDQLLEQAIASGWISVAVFAFMFALNGITMIRMYSHLFWGKREHDQPDRSFDLSNLEMFSRVALFVLVNGLQIYLLKL
ncbi:MAG: proton-conducting transporter membrane subunit [Myxococcaceae bacterium]